MKCPKCRTENPETRKFCKKCGTKLLLVCPDCHFENAPGDKFCGDCGKDLGRPKEAKPVDYSAAHEEVSLAMELGSFKSPVKRNIRFLTVLTISPESSNP